MLPDIGGESGAKLAVALAAVAAALLVFFFVLQTWRQRGTRAFLRGGKNRRPRLAVLDAAAVDPRRRLVLVRRDEVEHLILIGGPSDLVVESGIGTRDRGVAAPSFPATLTGAPAAQAAVPEAAAPHAAPAVEETTHRPDGKNEESAATSGTAAGTAPLAEAEAGETAETRRAAATQASVAGARQNAEARSPTEANAPDGNIADVLDRQRQRVFGSAEPVEPSPYERAYTEDGENAASAGSAGEAPAPPASSVLRFEDFLDTEVASELSSLKPERLSSNGQPAPSPQRLRAASDATTDARSKTLDEEMSRLLQQLSHKR